MTHTIKVEIDQDLHGEQQPESPTEAYVWAAMDTAWNLLRETAIRRVLDNLRTSAAEASGRVIPSNEVIFQKMSDANDGARIGYRDLAPEGCPPLKHAFATVFAHLMDEAAEDMGGGLEDL